VGHGGWGAEKGLRTGLETGGWHVGTGGTRDREKKNKEDLLGKEGGHRGSVCPPCSITVGRGKWEKGKK